MRWLAQWLRNYAWEIAEHFWSPDWWLNSLRYHLVHLRLCALLTRESLSQRVYDAAPQSTQDLSPARASADYSFEAVPEALAAGTVRSNHLSIFCPFLFVRELSLPLL
jgi:hypothetical protein